MRERERREMARSRTSKKVLFSKNGTYALSKLLDELEATQDVLI